MSKSKSILALGVVLALSAARTSAQDGSLDQIGRTDAALNIDTFTGQQQVRAGRAGTLEGIEIGISTAPPGSIMNVTLRLGPGPNSSPAVWAGSFTTHPTQQTVNRLYYLDTSSAGIQLAADELFVVEVERGNATGQLNILMGGPDPANLYPEPFFLLGSVFPRTLCFRTWMDGGVGSRYCVSSPNSVSPSGARLSVHGSTSVSAGDLVLTASRAPSNFGIYFYGSAQVQIPIGDGALCVTGQPTRLPIVLGENFLLTYPIDYAHPRAAALVPGSTWNFQAWFRDPPAMGSGFNFSDAVQLTFTP